MSAVKYRTICADPPWPITWSTPETRINGRGERHPNHTRELSYPTLTVDAIAALQVWGAADPAGAHLYLWAPDSFLLDGSAKRVVEAWGFMRPRLLVWRKSGFGLGTFPRPQHEACIVAVFVAGSLPFGARDVGSVFDGKLVYEDGRRKHSAKPDSFYDLVERVSPGPYLELFARRQRLGWHVWGNEVDSHVELSA